jgi:signal transduction histidine kinase
MRLRTKIVLYLVVIHTILATAAVFVLMENRQLLFAVELIFAASIFVSYRLVSALFVPLDLITTGAELIHERDFASQFVPVGQPEMDALIGVYNGMIDRLREERLAAEERHQLLQQIVNASPSGIIICDFDGNIESMNPAARRLASPAMLEELRSIAPGESRLIAHDPPRRMKVWSTEFRDRGFVKTFYLLEELTEELRQSERAAFEKLVRMMSHEVNNSAGAVRSLLESMLRYQEQIGPADRDDFVGAVNVASARMDSLNRFMTSFADVVRIPPPRRAPTDLRPLVERVVTLLSHDLAARNITLTTALDGSRPLEADRVQMEQVLINILRNAIDATGRDGSIEIALSDRALTIADSGSGIRPEIAGELFTPFFTTKKDGRGLGLTIVQEILANHGFGYSLKNRAGGGAEFTISFGEGGGASRPVPAS